MNTLLEFLLTNALVQGALVTLILAGLAFLIKKQIWVKHITNIAILAYEYAEEEGILKDIKGFEKFKPFMEDFIAKYREKYGKDPSPEDKGIAVKVMEKKVQEEHLGK